MPKHCAYCGLTLEQFISFGKFGCEFCLDFVRKHDSVYRKAISRIPSDDIDPFCLPFKSYATSLLESKTSSLSIRYRIARNFRKQIFPFFRKDTSFEERYLRNLFPELGEFQTLNTSGSRKSSKYEIHSQIIRKANIIKTSNAQGNFLVGDEDCIRFEWIQNFPRNLLKKAKFPILPNSELNFRILRFLLDSSQFSHQMNWGYLNSCPTNSGKGDRLSIQLFCSLPKEISSDSTEVQEQILNLEENGISFAREKSMDNRLKITFSVKNFTKKRKNHFLSLMNP